MIYPLKPTYFVSSRHGLQTSYIDKINEKNRLDITLGTQVREATSIHVPLDQGSAGD